MDTVGEEIDELERVTLKHTHYHIQNRELVWGFVVRCRSQLVLSDKTREVDRWRWRRFKRKGHMSTLSGKFAQSCVTLDPKKPYSPWNSSTPEYWSA